MHRDPTPPSGKSRDCPERNTSPNLIDPPLHPPPAAPTLVVSIPIDSTDRTRVLINPPYQPDP